MGEYPSRSPRSPAPGLTSSVPTGGRAGSTTGSWSPPPADGVAGIRGDEYDRRFEERERAGQDVHGEADFVAALGPATVLDAGCGTGRVAIELARRGFEVVGVDIDPDMLGEARRKAPELEWVEGDLTTIELNKPGGGLRQFEAAVLAGNVMIFLEPGSEALALANIARHLAGGGLLIAGFQIRPGGLTATGYEQLAGTLGLRVVGRWSGWAREPWSSGGDYVVSVHRM